MMWSFQVVWRLPAFFLIRLTLIGHLRAAAIIGLVVEDKAEVGQARCFPVEMFNARR
jgi:hypothetical protein